MGCVVFSLRRVWDFDILSVRENEKNTIIFITGGINVPDFCGGGDDMFAGQFEQVYGFCVCD